MSEERMAMPGRSYSYKDNVYEVIGVGMMKVDGSWRDAVTYKRRHNDMIFTRETSDFLDNFTLLPE